MTIAELGLICPRCRGDLLDAAPEMRCASCDARFPVVAGIPDLRVHPDPWIDPADDRAKALRVLEMTETGAFEEAVRAYWSLTPGTPRERADRFTGHVLAAGARSGEWLEVEGEAHPVSGAAVWLDEGCGTADLAAAAPEGVAVVGLDVAMRWLVVARRRLERAGRPALLVCANAEALPFRDASVDRVFSLGMLEHCTDLHPVFAEARRVLAPGGVLRMRTLNRFSPLPEPHVGVWGVGYVPRRWQSRYVRHRTGADYAHHRLWSPGELASGLRRAGFRSVGVAAAPTLEAERSRASTLVRRLAPFYEAARTVPVVRRGVRLVAPILSLTGVAP